VNATPDATVVLQGKADHPVYGSRRELIGTRAILAEILEKPNFSHL
jgi:hypothetical protein